VASDAAYDIYELLRTLIDRVAWPSEEEKLSATRSVTAFEQAGMFGNVAEQLRCEHPAEARHEGQCQDCGRQVEPRSYRGRWGQNRGVRT
jgi:hypothetical protein